MPTDYRPPDPEEASSEREEVLSRLAATIRSVHERIEAREAEGLDDIADEQLQIKWIRAQGYLTGQYRKLLKDTDIDEMRDDVELLREVFGEDER